MPLRPSCRGYPRMRLRSRRGIAAAECTGASLIMVDRIVEIPAADIVDMHQRTLVDRRLRQADRHAEADDRLVDADWLQRDLVALRDALARRHHERSPVE